MKKVLTLAAVAMLFTTLAGASAFADQRNPEGTWRDGQYRDNDRVTVDRRELRGIVHRVNYRLHYVIVREWDGDFVKVDTRPIERRRREPDTDDLRRGDAISISGYWRDGLFRAEHIDHIRRGW